MFFWVFRNPKKIILVTALISCFALWGMVKIDINNNFLDDLNDNSALKEDLNFFEQNFSGIRPFEMGIDLVDTSGNILDKNVLVEIEKVENYLKVEYGIGFILSPITIVKSINMALNGGKNDFYKLPESDSQMNKINRLINRYKNRRGVPVLLSNDQLHGRIAGKMKDLGSKKVGHLNDDLNDFISNNIDHSLLKFELTGAAELMDSSNSRIASYLIVGLGFAFLVIALVIGLIFRSGKVAIISLLPNFLPLLMIAGIMGIFNIELKVATALIFTIALGIAIDDTIHLLSRYKTEMTKTTSSMRALKTAYLSTGKAIILTSIILSSGFVVFTMSEFYSTFYIGLLVSITLLIALTSNLVILPLLISKFYKKKGF